MKILVCAGGTGGGIYPALTAVMELLRQGLSKEDVLWVGAAGEMEETLVPRAGLTLTTIRGGAIAGVPWRVKLINAARLAGSLIPSGRILRRFRPDVMLMTGGYLSLPVALAAWLRRVPIVIFLPDVEPGAAIKAVMPLAAKVACTSPDSRQFVPAAKLVVTGYPLRHELERAAQMSREAALAQFDLQPGRPTLLVFGGSRGSQNINRALLAALPDLLPALQIIHISGTLTWPEVETNLARLPEAQRAFYRAYPYLHEEMGAALRAADLMVTRAGASVMGEAPAFALPSILVPLTWAWRYQKVNADFLTRHGAAVQLTDETLAAKLAATVKGLLHDETKLAGMRTAVQSLHQPAAAAKLAEVLMTTGRAMGLS